MDAQGVGGWGARAAWGVLGSRSPEVLAGSWNALSWAGWKALIPLYPAEHTWADPWGSVDTNFVQRKSEGGALSPLRGQLHFCSLRSPWAAEQGGPSPPQDTTPSVSGEGSV